MSHAPGGIKSAFTVLLVLALTALLASCGSPDDTADASAGSGGSDSSSGSEPVAAEHAFGTTEVEGTPERIVSLDVQWTDTLLAMGIEPVGYGEDSLMPDEGPPWWDDMSGEPLNLDDGLPIEKIAGLEPDLIVGTYSIADEKAYQQLAAIAPTVAGQGGTSVQRWQDLVTTTGEIIDDPDRANEVIASVHDEIAAVSEEFPDLNGKTFALAQYIVGDAMYVVADEQDGSGELFEKLGMKLLPAAVRDGEKSDSARLEVSTERVDLLESDLLVFLVNGGDKSDLEDIPGFDALPASKSGAAAILDYATVVGINTPTPLSVPYALDKLSPYLEKVA